MGDRVHADILIYGTIDTPAKLARLVKAILDAAVNSVQINVFDETKLLDDLREISREDYGPVHVYDSYANYGYIDEVTDALEELGIPYVKSWEEGGGFGAGTKAWTPDGAYRADRVKGSGAAIDVTDLEKALKSEDPIAEAQKLVDRANKADGAGMPRFHIPDDVFSNYTAGKMAMAIEDSE